MDQNHPDYTEQPLAADLRREHFLHKVVAGSAFVFALALIPVTQYFLFNGFGGAAESGQVAGVSTVVSPTPVNALSVPADGETLLGCVQKKESDTENLTLFAEGKKKAMLRDYERAVEPYRSAVALLQGSSEQVEQERVALQQLIDGEYETYLANLTAVETAVADAQREIDARVCPAE